MPRGLSILVLASRNLFFKSLRFICASLLQLQIFSNNSKWPLPAANSRRRFPSHFGPATIRLGLAVLLAQPHNVSNASNVPLCAALCHTLYPYWSLVSNSTFFKSFGLTGAPFAHSHIFLKASK